MCIISIVGCTTTSKNTGQQIPFLKSESGVETLYVENTPYLMLAGELHNSTAGSAHKLNEVWTEMASLNLNTLLLPVAWELVEPEEGRFDFSLVDNMVLEARRHNIKLVILWFGSWKNGKSTYVPAWVKSNPSRFPLAVNKNGHANPALSALSEENLDADANAFSAFMEHLRKIDSQQNTVIMVQVENELGLLGTSRDFSKEANRLYSQSVPSELIDYLVANKHALHPALFKAWEQGGFKTVGSWEDVFGSNQESTGDDWKNEYSNFTDEIFTTWHYAKYVGEIARRGKQQYELPMFANAWQKQPEGQDPGEYPTGGPLPHVSDLWKSAAPAIDFIAPDIYELREFDWFCESYIEANNPLFIPEIKVGPNSSARAFYAIGKYHAIGYSPFGIDGGGLFGTRLDDDMSLKHVYRNLAHLAPQILAARGTENMTGLFLDEGERFVVEDLGDWKISINRFSSEGLFKMTGGRFGVEGEEDTSAGGLLVIRESDDQFLVVGGVGGMQIAVTKGTSSKYNKVGISSVDEITYIAGEEHSHRLNGDEMAMGGPAIKPGEVKIFRIKMYGL